MVTRSVLALAALSILSTANANAAQPATFKEKILYSFAGGTDGSNPRAALVDVNGTLYGTTTAGGTTGNGTVFSLDPKTRTETVVYSFAGGTDGAAPFAPLIDVNGTLYGTTVNGGASGAGTVFKFDPTTGAETVLYAFAGGTDGANPFAALLDLKGTLYSTTDAGGTSGNGTVFKVDPNTGAETVLHSFAGGTDGASSKAPLMALKGELYGVTSFGGASGVGIVFAIDPNTGAETVLHSFGGSTDGNTPLLGGLTAVNGTLYGTTIWGGANCQGGGGCGAVYSVDPSTGAEAVVYSFCCDDANGNPPFPYAGLLNVKGTLYGTTLFGADYDNGMVYAIAPKTGAETQIYSFGNGAADGSSPSAPVIAIKGSLYGTTYGGGTSGAGTVFELKKKH